MTIARELANLLNSSGKVEGTKIADDAINSDHYAPKSIPDLAIANNTITAAEIAGDTITAAEIATNTITATQIAGDTITAAEIAANAVGSSELGPTSVTSTELADNAVIDAKLNTTGTMPAWNGSALTDLPYDVAFTAGFDKDMDKEDVEVATYGELVMARAGTFVGEAGYADTAPSGNTVLDITKNNSTIYSNKPQFASGTGLSAGTLSTTAFIAGDRITFKITAIGATPGEGIRFTLKCKV
jgi:hypothetical protein